MLDVDGPGPTDEAPATRCPVNGGANRCWKVEAAGNNTRPPGQVIGPAVGAVANHKLIEQLGTPATNCDRMR